MPLANGYPYVVIAEEEGGFFIEFPDLPGCMTQAEAEDEIQAMSEDASACWLESARETGMPFPDPPLDISPEKG